MQYSILLALVAAILLVAPATATKQCSPRVVSLATGIHLNIIGQHGEPLFSPPLLGGEMQNSLWPAPCYHFLLSPSLLSGELASTEKLQKIESEPNKKGYRAAFEVAKGELLSDIAGGIKIRKFNQQVIPPGNAATAGLNKYASAQLTEQKLAESLTGVPHHDKSILKTLVSDIKSGTKLNEDNFAEVCSSNLRWSFSDYLRFGWCWTNASLLLSILLYLSLSQAHKGCDLGVTIWLLALMLASSTNNSDTSCILRFSIPSTLLWKGKYHSWCVYSWLDDLVFLQARLGRGTGWELPFFMQSDS